MGFSTKECAYAHITLQMLGRTFVGLRGFSFEKNIDKEYLHGAGNEPIDIQVGNKTYPVTLKLLKYEVDALNDAALNAGFDDILEVPHDAITITCSFKKNATDKIRTIVAAGVAFSNIKFGQDQGAKFTEVDMPALAMKVTMK